MGLGAGLAWALRKPRWLEAEAKLTRNGPLWMERIVSREDKAATKQVTFAVCKSIDFESWLFLTEKPFSRPVHRTVFCEPGALLLLARVSNSESQVELSQVELRVQKQKVIFHLFWSSRHSGLGGVPPLEVRYLSQGRCILLFSHRPSPCSLLSIIAQSQLQRV